MIWMGDQPMLPGRPYLFKIGGATVRPPSRRIKHQIKSRRWSTSPRARSALNEIGVCNVSLDRRSPSIPMPRTAIPAASSSSTASPTRRWARAAAFRAAPRRQYALAGLDVSKATRAAAKGPEALRAVVHRPVGRRQIDHRQPGREQAARDRPAHLSARRRQYPPRAEPAISASPPADRVENIRRVGRGGQADGRCRADRAGGLHLAVPRRAPAWPAS